MMMIKQRSLKETIGREEDSNSQHYFKIGEMMLGSLEDTATTR
jgi:hypothetical protein